ncbi:MAG TPA: glycosyltransferase [Candidatus Cloacimonadota bacterium]|nr:glycosyltransferase [Candidatus Cloacimonadota bacterium]HPT72546.1 glycosyltransferase [Candidatus Cloacimonadota bacterium]
MPKLLYVDVPFSGVPGGDKNRSRFLWNQLQQHFDVDLLLIRTADYLYQPIPPHQGKGKVFVVGTQLTSKFWSQAIYSFGSHHKKKFKEILINGKYDYVFFRFLSPSPLARIATQVLPHSKVVFDVDMLFSRICSLSWEHSPDLQHRYYFVEKTKLQIFERIVFHRPYMFFFSNSEERDMVYLKYQPHAPEGRFCILPNMMEEVKNPIVPSDQPNPYIIFFGTLNSAANQDAFIYLAKEIYPLLAKTLQEKRIDILVVGKDPMAMHTELSGIRLKLIGPVQDLNSMIANSLFVILPLRVASGTRTRILEAAAVKKAVLTTKIGAEGFDFTNDEIFLAEGAHEFANKVIDLLQKPDMVQKYGERLHDKAKANYVVDIVSQRMLADIDKFGERSSEPSNKLKIAIVTNRFYPEVGGAETNIYFQARKLAEKYDVTVICPKRIEKPRYEFADGFHIYRLHDVMNKTSHFPNLSSRTFCPEIFHIIAKGEFDVIQCFPAINHNNMLAFMAAKINRIPIILCSFDFLDYAGIIKRDGRIDPDILRHYQPNWRQKFFLKHFDHIFAICNKEMDFFKKYNDYVEYSPVPINVEEYEQEIPSPRPHYGIGDDEFVFLCLGRVSNVKGQDIALKAYQKALKELPNSRLVFVGRKDYEPEFYREMKDRIDSDPHLKERVIFTDMVDRTEVLGWLRYSDIHVIPVRFMNSGAVVVESWMSWTPVLQSDVVDPNLVVEDHNSYNFISENIDSLAEKMKKAYLKKNDFPILAENGMRLVKEKYTYEYLIELYEKTYERLT